MKSMNRTYKTFLITTVALFSQFCFLATVHAQSTPNLYKVFISLDGVTTNNFGQLSRVFADKADIIRRCADQSDISNRGGLALVYDRDSDALEVINRTNGAVVCSPIAFSGGFSLTNSATTARERLTFVYVEGSEQLSGSLDATERFVYDNQGNVIRYSLSGRIQFALTPTDRSSKIFSGFVTTGPRFVPGSR